MTLYSTLVMSVFPEGMSIRTHCASGTGGLAPGWISYTCPDDGLRYLNLLSDEWDDGTTMVAAMVQDEKPPNTRDAPYRGEHTHHGHNPNFKHGVPPGKYQELAEFVVKEREKRQRYQAMYKRSVAEIVELRHQLATWWESNDEERARMQLDYDAFVASDRVGDEPDDDVSPTIVTPLMSSDSSRVMMGHGSVDLSEPGVCEFVRDEGEEEEEEDEEAAPPPSKKPKASDDRDSMGQSMEY